MKRSAYVFAVALLLLAIGVSHASDVEVGGLVQARYTDWRGENATFWMRTARVKASVKVTEKINALVTIGVEKEPNIVDGYIDYSHSKLINVRAGQFKLPFGFETQIGRHDLEAMNRSVVFQCLWNNGVSANYVRDMGLMVMGRYKILEYKVGAVNGVGYNYTVHPEEDGIRIFPRWGGDNNNSKDIVGRVGVGVPMFAGLGFSFYDGRWPTYEGSPDNCDRTAKAFDLYLDTGKVLLQYEHVWAQGRVNNDALDFRDDKYGGYFVVVGYRINPLIEPVYKVDICDPNKDADGDRITDLYFGVNLNFQRSARVQLFYRESKLAKRFSDSAFLAQFSARF
jgi:hypothetical protein